MADETLPIGFESLTGFLRDWVLLDTAARCAKRQASDLPTLKTFYDAMLPLAPAAVDHLKQHKLGELPPDSERLLKLMLSLAEIAPAIEWYSSPKVYDGYDIDRLTPVRMISDTHPQT